MSFEHDHNAAMEADNHPAGRVAEPIREPSDAAVCLSAAASEATAARAAILAWEEGA